MPSQEDHEKPEDMVESPNKTVHSARNLEETVDSNGSMQGYYAMNNIKNPAELEKEAAEEEGDPNREKGHPVP